VSVFRFFAMGCELVVSCADESSCDAIQELFFERDQVFSRFRADSELSRVNACAGRPVRVSAEFASMLALALDAPRQTVGLVDPTIARALKNAGYDADFPLLRDDGRLVGNGPKGRWRDIRLVGRQLFLPTGVRLDLNGVVKAKTVDDATALLRGAGFVSAGGDLAIRGGDVVVALPGGGTVRLVRGALATSGSDRRRWTRGGVLQHHLIDPRTGAPSRSCWLQVTACGATCVAADIAAKAAFLLGRDGPAWLDAHGMPGRFVDAKRDVRTNESWRRSLEREVVCT
jgi:thiamine biosynthesis lipoprotein